MSCFEYLQAAQETEVEQSQTGHFFVTGKHSTYFPTSLPLEEEKTLKLQLDIAKLTPSFIRDNILNRDIVAKIAPILLIVGGLPDSKKTTAILKVIARLGGGYLDAIYVKESGINIYGHAAIISPPPGKKMIIETFSQEEGYSKVIHSAIENISRTKRDILYCGNEYEFRYELEHLKSFSASSLKKHFKEVCWILYKQTTEIKNQRQRDQTPDNWNKSFTTGIALINVWDVGFNKVATYILPLLAGHLTNSFVWMFLDLMRDIDKLYMSPDLPDNRFDRSRNDRELIMRWRARIHYLLRFAKFASSTSQKLEKHNKTCHIVASIAQGISSGDVFDKIKKLKTSVESAARQMEVDHSIDYENILKFTELDDACVKALEELFKKIVHDQLNNATEVPLSFIFLRSTFYNNKLYIRKSALWEVAKELNFSRANFKKFCEVFTSFGSIIDVSLINESSDLIILNPVDFINELDKLFYPSPEVDPLVTKYGIVTESTASHIFGPDASVIMEFLENINLAVKLPSSKFDIKLDDRYAHYIPNVRTSSTLLECEPTSLHFLRSVNRPTLHLQVLFAEKFLQNERSSLMVSHKPPNNVTHFKFFPSTANNEEGIEFYFIYLGDALEFRLPKDNKNKEICEKIIFICKKILPDDIKYNFAIMCNKEEEIVASMCTLQKARHLLPLKGTCRNCRISLDTASDAIKTWNSVIQQNGVPVEQKLNGAPLTQTELIDLSNNISRLSIEGASALAKALGCDEFDESQDANSKWRVFMMMILKWEKSPDPSIESQDSNKKLRSKKELAMIMYELSKDLIALNSDDRQLLMEMSASIDLTVTFKRSDIFGEVISSVQKIERKIRNTKQIFGMDRETSQTIKSQEALLDSKEDRLSEVHKAGTKLFIVQGDGPQLLNWEEYGLRIGVIKGTLLPSETAEIAVVALVGGQFEFPKGTQLVSAVYAISVSKPLNEPLRVDMQHCVNITRPSQTRNMKFAIAPVNTPSLPYQFEVMEGGEFTVNSFYGSIHRLKFCLLGILAGNGSNPGPDDPPVGNDEGQDEEDPSSSSSDEETNGHESQNGNTSSHIVKDNGSTSRDDESQTHATGATPLSTPSEEVKSESVTLPVAGSDKSSNDDSVDLVYVCILFDKKTKDKDLVIFATTKKLDVLLKYVEAKHCQADFIEEYIQFSFQSPSDHIELIFDDEHQKYPCTGWIIRPKLMPCKLFKKHIDNFGNNPAPVPALCSISVYSTNRPDTVPVLNYGIPLEGVDPPMTVYIHRALRTSTNTGTPLEATPSSSSGPQPIPSIKVQVDLNQLKKIINEVLQSHHADLTGLPEESIQDLADQLYTSKLISKAVKKNPTMDKCISEFDAYLKWLRSQSAIQSHCTNFLNAFNTVGGSHSAAANVLCEDLIEAVNNKLDCNFNIDLN